LIRKLSLILAACAVFAIAPASAQPATQTAAVVITGAGYVPSSVTINQGDSITWTNTDTADHQLTSGKTFTSPTLKTGQSFTFTFTASGTFTIKDSLNKGQKTTVVVTRTAPATGAAAVTLSASPLQVVSGTATHFSGTISTKQAGESVTILAQRYGDAKFSQLAKVTTTTGGAWSYSAKPTIQTSYQSQWKAKTSASLAIGVKPLVTFHVLTNHRFSTKAVAGRSFAGRIVQLQRRTSPGHWVTIQRVHLNASSAAIFRPTLPKGTSTLRMAMSVNQAGAGYLGGTSRTIVSIHS
jgi:plastocyanin